MEYLQRLGGLPELDSFPEKKSSLESRVNPNLFVSLYMIVVSRGFLIVLHAPFADGFPRRLLPGMSLLLRTVQHGAAPQFVTSKEPRPNNWLKHFIIDF